MGDTIGVVNKVCAWLSKINGNHDSSGCARHRSVYTWLISVHHNRI